MAYEKFIEKFRVAIASSTRIRINPADIPTIVKLAIDVLADLEGKPPEPLPQAATPHEKIVEVITHTPTQRPVAPAVNLGPRAAAPAAPAAPMETVETASIDTAVVETAVVEEDIPPNFNDMTRDALNSWYTDNAAALGIDIPDFETMSVKNKRKHLNDAFSG